MGPPVGWESGRRVAGDTTVDDVNRMLLTVTQSSGILVGKHFSPILLSLWQTQHARTSAGGSSAVLIVPPKTT